MPPIMVSCAFLISVGQQLWQIRNLQPWSAQRNCFLCSVWHICMGKNFGMWTMVPCAFMMLMDQPNNRFEISDHNLPRRTILLCSKWHNCKGHNFGVGTMVPRAFVTVIDQIQNRFGISDLNLPRKTIFFFQLFQVTYSHGSQFWNVNHCSMWFSDVGRSKPMTDSKSPTLNCPERLFLCSKWHICTGRNFGMGTTGPMVMVAP